MYLLLLFFLFFFLGGGGGWFFKTFLSDFGITSRYIKMSLGFFFRPNRKVTLVYDSLGLMDFFFSFLFF
jgi:hypothetical protein